VPAAQTRDDPREAGGTGARDEATALRPDRPRLVLRPTAALFGGLALARRDRSMHGPGLAFRCRVEIDPPPGYVEDAPLLERPATHDATIRFSRGIGLPQPWADLLGIAVRIHGAYGPGVPQDLLVTSSGGARGARRLLLPARDGFFGQWFSSVLPYRVGPRRTLLGDRAVSSPAGEGTDFERLEAAHRRGGVTFALALADDRGWTRVGTIRLGERLTDEEAAALVFEPWTTGGGIRPVGVLNRLRAAAYPASRGVRRRLS
jgi:hypothetical protein